VLGTMIALRANRCRPAGADFSCAIALIRQSPDRASV
jgi:hypothetical protein